jgi:hypothetical protein
MAGNTGSSGNKSFGEMLQEWVDKLLRALRIKK